MAATEIPPSHKDLLDAQFATLATVGADGVPQLTEVWFLAEDRELKVSLNTSRLKTKNLQARPQCSLFILDLENPYRYVDVRGRTTPSPGGWGRSTAPTCASTTVPARAAWWS